MKKAQYVKETSGGKSEVNGMQRRGCPGVAKWLHLAAWPLDSLPGPS
jgi:hypothetical protein